MSTYAPFAKPLYVMLKPVGAVCNLACDYCYYLEKSKLYRDNPKHVMSEELLEKFIEEYINSQTMPQVLFTWHGGETLMRPLSFYKRAMELQRKLPKGGEVAGAIRTRPHHREQHSDQRHASHRQLVPVLQGEQLAGGCLHRRASGVP